MSLREHVCDDDVNAAITMLIASFINAQKNSVRSSLERGFRKYLVYRSDFFDLLLPISVQVEVDGRLIEVENSLFDHRFECSEDGRVDCWYFSV